MYYMGVQMLSREGALLAFFLGEPGAYGPLQSIGFWGLSISAMSHLRFCCDFDAACDKQTWLQVCLSHAASKSQRATMKSHAATLSRVRVARQGRATKSQV